MMKRTFLIVLEAVALDTVKTAVQMGLSVWCDQVDGGWLITVER